MRLSEADSTIATPRAGREAATPPPRPHLTQPPMPRPIPPSDHAISLEDAIDIRKRHEGEEKPKRWPVMTFHRHAYERILGQPGCAAIRIYPARHPDGRLTVVMVGVDEQGADMTQGALAQEPFLCPPYCDEDSPLA